MKPEFQPLFQPLLFNNGVSTQNRLVVAPMTHWASDNQGRLTDAERTFLQTRSAGFGLFITAATAVNWSSRAFTGEPNLIQPNDVADMKERVQIIHENGALAVIQLHHAGNMAKISETNGHDVVAPSATETARELTDDEIRQIIQDFANATELAIEAGFDGVEIHGANGYLFQQFVSQKSNKRTDEWGGSLENRMRFSLAVTDAVVAVREKYQRDDFIIGYRFSPEESDELGLTMTDTLALVDALTERPLQYVHVSLQDFFSLPRRGADVSQTRLQHFHKITTAKNIALIGVGGVKTAADALKAVQSGDADLVAIGRTLVPNPNFVELIESGNEEQIVSDFDWNKTSADYQINELFYQHMGWFYPKP